MLWIISVQHKKGPVSSSVGSRALVWYLVHLHTHHPHAGPLGKLPETSLKKSVSRTTKENNSSVQSIKKVHLAELMTFIISISLMQTVPVHAKDNDSKTPTKPHPLPK